MTVQEKEERCQRMRKDTKLAEAELTDEAILQRCDLLVDLSRDPREEWESESERENEQSQLASSEGGEKEVARPTSASTTPARPQAKLYESFSKPLAQMIQKRNLRTGNA